MFCYKMQVTTFHFIAFTYSDGETFIHLDACPTPKNKTIDFIMYGGYREPQHVYEGKTTFQSPKFTPTFQPGFVSCIMRL